MSASTEAKIAMRRAIEKGDPVLLSSEAKKKISHPKTDPTIQDRHGRALSSFSPSLANQTNPENEFEKNPSILGCPSGRG